MRVYISGALHAATDLAEARRKYELLAATLNERGIEAYLPHKQTDPILSAALLPREVYLHDLMELDRSDVLMAFLEEPSLGVGAEMVIALQKGKHVIGLLHKGRQTSRFILGLLELHENALLIDYEELGQAVNRVCQTVGWVEAK